MILPLVFVLASAAAPAFPPPLPLDEAVKGSLNGAGAEPFWGLAIAPDTVTLTEPAEEGDTTRTFEVTGLTQTGAAWVFAAGALTVTLSPETCSDGMSEYVYPYTVEAALAERERRTLKGCAYRPWGQDILAAMPAIDACLPAKGDKPLVIYARAAEPGAGFVITMRLDGEGYDACTVTGGKASKARFAGEEMPAGTNAELFVRGPGENPGGECYAAPEVRDADGKLLGWWLDPEGC